MLSTFVAKLRRAFVARCDRLEISRINLRDPDGNYWTIARDDVQLLPATLVEVRVASARRARSSRVAAR